MQACFQGFVRYTNDGDAEKAMKALLEKHENKVMLRDLETTLRVIEGTVLWLIYSTTCFLLLFSTIVSNSFKVLKVKLKKAMSKFKLVS
jgi:hypothetical protein